MCIKYIYFAGYLLRVPTNGGDRGNTVVKVLRYKSEGLWFDPN